MLSPVKLVKWKLFDMAALLLYLTLIILASLGNSGQGNREKNRLLIDFEGGQESYSLSQDRDVALKGPVGTSIVRIAGGEACFLHSDCPEGLCTAMKAISRGGEWAACLPNRVFISIGGHSEVDAAAY